MDWVRNQQAIDKEDLDEERSYSRSSYALVSYMTAIRLFREIVERERERKYPKPVKKLR